MGTPPPTPRRVLLTGATGGLGPSLATSLARTGAALALSALPEPELHELAGRLIAEREESSQRAGAPPSDPAADDTPSPAIVAIPADLRDPDAPARMVAAAADALGGIDVLVHNAGLERVGRFEAQSSESLEAVTRVNLLSAMELSRLVLPAMVERGWGRLVFVASLSAKTAPACTGAYGPSKAGLLTLARTLRAEYRGTGVSASAVVPGFIREVGMYGRGRREAGFGGSWLLGTVSAGAVARAVVRALERDPPEVLVQRGPTRLVLALAELFPGLIGERLNRWVGADRIFREWSEARAAEPGGGAVGRRPADHGAPDRGAADRGVGARDSDGGGER